MFSKKSFYWINKTNTPSNNKNYLVFVALSLFITLIIFQVRWAYAQAFGEEPITSPITSPVTSPVSPTPSASPSATPEPTASPSVTPSPTLTPVPDTEAPNVFITYPIDGSRVKRKSFVNIQTTATDNVQVEKVEFYVNGKLICTDYEALYSCSWFVPKKAKVYYDIQAVVYDASGNSGVSNIVKVKSARR